MHEGQRYSRDKKEQLIFSNKYKLIKKIGSGSFGQIYLCEHLQRKQLLAAKIKKQKGEEQLQYQIKLYQIFNNIQGIARMYDYGFQKNQYFLIMELLGSSLEELLQENQRKFSISTVLQIGIQIINRLQAIHQKGFIHRDIKANNFMIGRNDKQGVVYIIDFGLSKRYIDSKTGFHIPFKQGKSLVGTARYTSIASHQGKQQGRKDDLQSLGFLLLYFARGRLPWQGVNIKNKTEKYLQIGRIKRETTIQKLAGPLGKGPQNAFVNYFAYVRSLSFTEKPNYDKIRSYFKNQLISSNQQNKKLDWLVNNRQSTTTNGTNQSSFRNQLDLQ